jgi:hypothetical protein
VLSSPPSLQGILLRSRPHAARAGQMAGSSPNQQLPHAGAERTALIHVADAGALDEHPAATDAAPHAAAFAGDPHIHLSVVARDLGFALHDVNDVVDGTPRVEDCRVSCPSQSSSSTPPHTPLFDSAAALEAAEREARCEDGMVTRAVFGDVLHVRCVLTGVHVDIAVCGFWHQLPRQRVRPLIPYTRGAGGWPFPYIPDSQSGMRVLNCFSYFDTLPGGSFVQAPRIGHSGWSGAERCIQQRLGPMPPPDDEVACAEYQAQYAAALRDDPPPYVSGAILVYGAEEAQQAAVATRAAREAELAARTMLVVGERSVVETGLGVDEDEVWAAEVEMERMVEERAEHVRERFAREAEADVVDYVATSAGVERAEDALLRLA